MVAEIHFEIRKTEPFRFWDFGFLIDLTNNIEYHNYSMVPNSRICTAILLPTNRAYVRTLFGSVRLFQELSNKKKFLKISLSVPKLQQFKDGLFQIYHLSNLFEFKPFHVNTTIWFLVYTAIIFQTFSSLYSYILICTAIWHTNIYFKLCRSILLFGSVPLLVFQNFAGLYSYLDLYCY